MQPIPSATIVLIRFTSQLEVLLVKRNDCLRFLPGYWVFPGGAVEPADEQAGYCIDQILQQAAIRETKEEVALTLLPEQLTRFAHWITPSFQPKRFSTYFYWSKLGNDASQCVQVDGSELIEHQWLSPQAAIEQHRTGRAPMLPPTLVCLRLLQECKGVDEVREKLALLDGLSIEPEMKSKGDEVFMLYPGDAALNAGNGLDMKEPLHRCILTGGAWYYRNSAANIMD